MDPRNSSFRYDHASNTSSSDIASDREHDHGFGDTWTCKFYTFIVYSVLAGLLCVLGVIGNLATFIVFLRDTMKTSTSFLFQGLSLIDMVLLVSVFPVYCLSPSI